PQSEPQFQGAGDSGSGWLQEDRPVLRSQRVRAATARHLRQFAARILYWAWSVYAGHFTFQEIQHRRETNFAVPGGGVQRDQSRELYDAQPGGLLRHELQPQCGDPDADSRLLAPDPVCVEADFLNAS